MKFRIIPVIIAVSALLATTASHQAQAGPREDREARGSDDRALARQLGLKPDQRKKVREIQDRLHKQQALIRAEIEVASIDLRRELEKDSPSEKRAGALVEKVSKLEGRLRKAHIVSTLRIKKLLDKEQRRKLEGMQGRSMRPPVAIRIPSPPRAPKPPRAPRHRRPSAHIDDEIEFGDFDVDFDFDFDFDQEGLSPKIRKEIEREMAGAKREMAQAKREIKRAKREAKREAKRAMKEASRAQKRAEREMRRHLKAAGHTGREGNVVIYRTNKGGKGLGKLQLNSTPPAEIYVKGKKLGVTPLITTMKTGRVTLEARWKNGKRKTLTLVVNSGDTVNVVIRPPN